MSIKIAAGVDEFAKLREGNYYYVDKTFLIEEILSQQFEAELITRPRRFGKSLTISMQEDFFDITRDSKARFEGLRISENRDLCEEWMNQWPVLSLSLKRVEGLNYQKAFGMLRVLIADLCKRYAFLEDSERVDEADKKLFLEMKFQEADEENLKSFLSLLTRMLTNHYGKPVILLIDEYDVPLAKAHEKGYYAEMLDTIRAILGVALKTNPYLKFAVITGCLKISKESIFTGINNLVVNTITTERFDESIGFTEPEVEMLLAAAGFADHAKEVQDWYDGYRFGDVDVYCPWDVLNHVAALMENPKAKPRGYWLNTSSNDVIYKLFENETFDVNGKFETLLAGGCICETITEDLTCDSLEASEMHLWSLLYMTGYLTRSGADYQGQEMFLKIPNEEIKEIFRKTVVEWFQKNVQTVDRSEIFASLWNGDAETAEQGISDLLFESISYYDYRESYYHAFAAGLFAGAGYIVESNYEYGDGRPDVVIKEKKKRRAMIFEIKYAGRDETLTHACEAALEQIRDRKYEKALIDKGYHTVISYGIAFQGKNCEIALCENQY